MVEVEIPDPTEKPESPFAFWGAIIISAYAVALALCSLGGSNVGKEMMMSQQAASNNWAHFQAKSSREHSCMLARMKLEVDLAERGPTMSADARKRADDLLAKLKSDEQRYAKEKEEIAAKAKEEQDRLAFNSRKDPYFDYGEVLLQIAIVLASIALLNESKAVMLISGLLACLGAFLTLNGYLLLVAIPGLS